VFNSDMLPTSVTIFNHLYFLNLRLVTRWDFHVWLESRIHSEATNTNFSISRWRKTKPNTLLYYFKCLLVTCQYHIWCCFVLRFIDDKTIA